MGTSQGTYRSAPSSASLRFSATKSQRGGPRSRTSSTLTKLLRVFCAFYLILALLYTSWHIVALPVSSFFIRQAGKILQLPGIALDTNHHHQSPDTIGQSGDGQLWQNHIDPSQLEHGHSEKQRMPPREADDSPAEARKVDWQEYGRVQGVEWDKDFMYWSPSISGREPIASSEDLFLSKAFSETLQPTKVIPYYYRAASRIDKKDITITTLVTSNRFKVLAALAQKYQGPISVTIHVANDPASRSALLTSLHELYTSSPSMSLFVDVHLVVDNFDRQFNMWRNVAKYFSRTDYIMMLDVDFAICTDFRQSIFNNQKVMNMLEEGSAALVVPAFEFTKQADGLDPTTFPENKKELLQLVETGKLGMFHAFWNPGHGSTNYTRYYREDSEIYEVQTYNQAYEPYVIFKKEASPFCDERFVGYGANKAACLYELYLSGISFYVLPNDFLIHQSHEYAEAARKNERRYNRKLYLDFREELCFRYLNRFIENGKINSSVSRNLMVECKKIKGFSGAASRVSLW